MDLGIGITEGWKFLAVVPCPSNGDLVSGSEASQLFLRGKRWPKVLELLAQSENGRTARISDLITKLGYAGQHGMVISEKQAVFDEGLGTKLKRAVETLRGAMADLARELRDQVTTTDTAIVLEKATEKTYQAAFTTGHLLRDNNGKTRFCWGPAH
jgi:hypothetical protein